MGSHEGKVKREISPFFHKAHIVDQILDLRQSPSSVSNYVNSFKELTHHYDLLKDPSITTARFVRGLRANLEREVTLFDPYIVDEVYRKALDVEKLEKFYPVQCSTPSSREPV